MPSTVQRLALACVALLSLSSTASLISQVAADPLPTGAGVAVKYDAPKAADSVAASSLRTASGQKKNVPATFNAQNVIFTSVQTSTVICSFDYSKGAKLFTDEKYKPPSIRISLDKPDATPFKSASVENIVDVQGFDASKLRFDDSQIIIDLQGCQWSSFVARIVIRFECAPCKTCQGGGGQLPTPTPTATPTPTPTPTPAISSTGFSGHGSSSDCFECYGGKSTAGGTGSSAETNPPPGKGGVKGDPQITGFLGQSFQVHGTSQTVYSMISSEALQYNALFEFRSEGKCRVGTECFSHPGNYLGAVAMLIKQNDGRAVALQVEAGPVDQGMKVSVDGKELAPSSDATHLTIDPVNSLHFTSKFELLVVTRDFTLQLQNSDRFINQQISINAPLQQQVVQYQQSLASKGEKSAEVDSMVASLPHGILGQTWRRASYPNRWVHIQGNLFDYIVSGGLEAVPSKFNRFKGSTQAEAEAPATPSNKALESVARFMFGPSN